MEGRRRENWKYDEMTAEVEPQWLHEEGEWGNFLMGLKDLKKNQKKQALQKEKKRINGTINVESSI